MLLKCPECELPISSKALSCPHCGYPLQGTSKRKPRKNKHMRLPNGFGQITKLSNPNLRNPYRAMVTVGKTDTGRPICKILKPQGYFATYNDAYVALVEYNRNPYDLEDDMKVYELYEKWSADYFAKLKSFSSQRTIISAWKYCSSVYNMRVKDIRVKHIKYCMENGEVDGKKPSANIKSRIKSLFNLMLDYAVEYELVDRNYARSFNISDSIVEEVNYNVKSHVAFSDKEMELLWKYKSDPFINTILCQCYMGMETSRNV